MTNSFSCGPEIHFNVWVFLHRLWLLISWFSTFKAVDIFSPTLFKYSLYSIDLFPLKCHVSWAFSTIWLFRRKALYSKWSFSPSFQCLVIICSADFRPPEILFVYQIKGINRMLSKTRNASVSSLIKTCISYRSIDLSSLFICHKSRKKSFKKLVIISTWWDQMARHGVVRDKVSTCTVLK